MNRLILAVALAAGCTLASSAPALAAAKNYDCSKPGNANKAACKTGAKDAIKGSTKPAAATKAAKPAKEAKAAPAAKATPAKTATRNYDCSKPGNANKAQCKGKGAAPVKQAAAKPAPKAAPAKATPAAAAAKPAPKRTAAASASTENKNPAGAIAQCKDGTYSHAKTRTGACSRHGGVAKWG